MCEDTRIEAQTHTHTPLLLASEREMSLPGQDAGEGGVCCGDRRQANHTSSCGGPTKVWTFVLEHAHMLTKKVKSGLQSVLVCWQLCLPLR